jgi:hypothetical protein
LALAKFAESKFPKARGGSIFVGAGDSFAAGLAAFYMSKGAFIALDPYSIGSFPDFAAGRDVYFVSASGKTSSNIAAARRVEGIARKTFAVTANEDSRLAQSVDKTVKLPMMLVPRTPGLLSFSLSLFAVLKIAVGDVSCDFGKAFRRAKEDSGTISFARGTTYFLGNSAAYAAALYAAAKTYEFLGTRAHAELLEEFSHLELFSLRKSDVVNVFGCFDPSGVGPRLRRALVERGFQAHLVLPRGSTDVGRLFHSVFVAQIAVLREAETSGLPGLGFLGATDRLQVSDSMIY